jgi:Na+/melibiose symporter-like transporter
MVAGSVLTATLTTLLMSTLRDCTPSSWGQRRPYILLGYILWGNRGESTMTVWVNE